ncbi:MAG: hypothetical protein B6I26_01930 [Desulfobacteraceae bacterium 4572_130]|nr:MAG: hypothetical protein B6I26_01930 [Desulfobacteraceae bacterium 4572_130]
MADFKAGSLPLLIGSFPINDHKKAIKLVFEYTPEIPLWVQLPFYKEEGMLDQFSKGMPGLTKSIDGKIFIDTSKKNFNEQCLNFYNDYLGVIEKTMEIKTSRFKLTGKRATGFNQFLTYIDDQINNQTRTFTALKGQVTGPVTFAVGITDQNNKAIFYNDELRDIAVKHIAMHGKYQAKKFIEKGIKPIIFFDEPVLAGFGTSAFITITKQDVTNALNEVIKAVHKQNGLVGVHVCANTEWSILFDLNIDIISFDSYSYFNKFILYPEMIKKYINRGGILAWGIVPTLNVNDIAKETTNSLTKKLKFQIKEIEKLGISKKTIIEQSFITPSCGTGSIDINSAIKVLELTRDVSKEIQSW